MPRANVTRSLPRHAHTPLEAKAARMEGGFKENSDGGASGGADVADGAVGGDGSGADAGGAGGV